MLGVGVGVLWTKIFLYRFIEGQIKSDFGMHPCKNLFVQIKLHIHSKHACSLPNMEILYTKQPALDQNSRWIKG